MKIDNFAYELPEYYPDLEAVLIQKLNEKDWTKIKKTKEEVLEYFRLLHAVAYEFEKCLEEEK